MNILNKFKNYVSFESLLIFFVLAGIYLFPDNIRYICLWFVVLFVACAVLKRRTLTISRTSVIWLVFLLYSFLTSLRSTVDMQNLLEFIISLIIGLMISFVSFSPKERQKMLFSVFLVAVIAYIGCLIQIISPETINRINLLNFSDEKYSYFRNFYVNNLLIGFSFQTGITGYYLSLFFGFLFCALISPGRKKTSVTVFTVILMISAYVFIFLTGKRIFILLTILIGIYLCFVAQRKHFSKILFFSLLLITTFYLLLTRTEIGQLLILRTTSAAWSTGRTGIYQKMLDAFKENVFFGSGTTSALSLVANAQNGHNIYLQILMEAGVIGFAIALLCFIRNIMDMHRLYKKPQQVDTWTLFAGLILLVFLGWGMSGNPLYDVYPVIPYFLSFSMIENMSRKEVKQFDENRNPDALLQER